jgi:hypothetical protein
VSLITLAEAKNACDVSNTSRDVFLQALIDGVEQWAQRYLGVSFTQTTVEEYLDGGGYSLAPTTTPVQSVSEVYDDEGGLVESEDDYDLRDDLIFRATDERWTEHPHNRWLVTYVGGYNGMPVGVKSALLMLIARAWANPEALQSQGAGGYSSAFQALAESDILFCLEPFRAQGGAIG